MAIEALNDILNPVSQKLRSLESHDENDHWLVDEILFEAEDYENSTHVLVGCPQDRGVVRNNGRPGAAGAPEKIRERLYKLQYQGPDEVKLFDAGNVVTDLPATRGGEEDFLMRVHNALSLAVKHFLQDGKTVIVLGGGNDISYADVRALAEYSDSVGAINIDAHLDMRKAEQMTSGTPYRMLIDSGFLKADNFHEFGIQSVSNSSHYLKEASGMGVHIHTLDEVLHEGTGKAFSRVIKSLETESLFLGLDMDSVRAADAPGVSASSPIGFSAREAEGFIRTARTLKNLRLFEITEVNPEHDLGDRTSKLAALLVYKFLFG